MTAEPEPLKSTPRLSAERPIISTAGHATHTARAPVLVSGVDSGAEKNVVHLSSTDPGA